MGRQLRYAAGVGALLLGSASVWVAGAGPAVAAPARGNTHSARVLLSAAISPSVPSDSAIFGSKAGTIPWSIAAGHVRLGANGVLQLNVARLIDPDTGVNPLPYLAASVYCAGSKVATTPAVPFSSLGNAHLHTMVSLPQSCAAPAVLVNPAKAANAVNSKVYIGYTGGA